MLSLIIYAVASILLYTQMGSCIDMIIYTLSLWSAYAIEVIFEENTRRK